MRLRGRTGELRLSCSIHGESDAVRGFAAGGAIPFNRAYSPIAEVASVAAIAGADVMNEGKDGRYQDHRYKGETNQEIDHYF
jgi:hypothetical protein